MNITDIKTEFGAYYLNNGQNMARIYQQLHAASTTDEVLTPFFTDETVYRASESRMTRLLQPFQKAFTSIDALTFVPAPIEMFKMKADVAEYPDDLEGSWLGFLASEKLDRKEWPFVRWFIEKCFIPQIKEDYELNEVWAGVYAAPTPGTAGDAGTAMNGLKKIIEDFITATRITPIVTGAPSATPETWTGQVEDFADDINTKYWNTPMNLCMNMTLARTFHRGYHKKYGQDTNYKDGKGEVPFTNLTVVGLPSMGTSNRIWATPKANALKIMKKSANLDKVQVENVDRQVKLYTDFWSGVGFIIPEIVFVNDQA